MNVPTLFDPVRIGAWDLPNRIVMSPLTRSRAGIERIPNALMAEYYTQRASAGLIISEATAVTPMGVGYADTPGGLVVSASGRLETGYPIGSQGGRAHVASTLACRTHFRSHVFEWRMTGGAQRHCAGRSCQSGSST
jgi:hypothetical protein